MPHHTVCLALLDTLGNPIISTSAHLPQDDFERSLSVEIESNISRVELFDRLDKVVDVIVDNGSEPGYQVSTILDLTAEEPIITRRGLGWEEAAAWATG